MASLHALPRAPETSCDYLQCIENRAASSTSAVMAVYGGDLRRPIADVVLEAGTPTEGMCGGVIWEGMKASRFHSVAQAGCPSELAPFMTDEEFAGTIEKINHSIQWGIDQRRCLCPLFCLLWLVTGLGALLLYVHIFCFHYPRAAKEIEMALQPWRAKGLTVKFVWAGAVCSGPAAMTEKNKIEIILPNGGPEGL